MGQGFRNLFKLLPREEKFFDLFEKMTQNIAVAVKQLRDLVENFEDVPTKAQQIKDMEHQGDMITHEIMKKVNTTFVTPIDREDIYALAARLDDVLDTIEAAAARMALYQVEGPTLYTRRFVEIIERSAEEIIKGVSKLRKLEDIGPYCVEINRLENEADMVLRDAYVELFKRDHDPVSIIKWKDIYEALEATTDRCEDVANILEAIVVKNA